MKSLLIKLFLVFIATMFLSFSALAQTSSIYEEELPERLREQLVKMQIDQNKNEFNKLVARAGTLAKLSNQIKLSFEKHKTLTNEDGKKLKEAQKLLKKIRRELNAKNDDKTAQNKQPKSLSHAITSLHKTTSNLLTEMKKVTRHSISVAAIQSSNTILRLVKFLRLKKP